MHSLVPASTWSHGAKRKCDTSADVGDKHDRNAEV